MSIDKIKQIASIMAEYRVKSVDLQTENETLRITMQDIATPGLPIAQEDAIKSPMVGIAYVAAAQGEKPLIEAPCDVDKGDLLCVIEAMKTFHTIVAEFPCRIARRLFENGEVVEYGQPLFSIVKRSG